MRQRPDQDALEAAEAALAVAARLLEQRAPAWPQALQGSEVAPSGPRHVAEALSFLAMPLDIFALAGASLKMRVPWLHVTLWMVPTVQDADRLMAEGVSRGRIWTAGELIKLMAIGDRTPETVKTLTHAKMAVDGAITEVRRRASADPDERTLSTS
jgi:hypothetical protein